MPRSCDCSIRTSLEAGSQQAGQTGLGWCLLPYALSDGLLSLVCVCVAAGADAAQQSPPCCAGDAAAAEALA